MAWSAAAASTFSSNQPRKAMPCIVLVAMGRLLAPKCQRFDRVPTGRQQKLFEPARLRRNKSGIRASSERIEHRAPPVTPPLERSDHTRRSGPIAVEHQHKRLRGRLRGREHNHRIHLRLEEVAGGRRGNLDHFDIDAFDPAYAPGTGTPTVGGITSYEGEVQSGDEVHYEPLAGETLGIMELYRHAFSPAKDAATLRRQLSAPIAIRLREPKGDVADDVELVQPRSEG